MLLHVSENKEVAKGIWEMHLSGDFPFENVQPGQFIHILIGSGREHVLRRPISIAAIEAEKETLVIVFRVVGEGTDWLAKRVEGDVLDVLGPLGTGFPLTTKQKILIVGGGIGVPPLYELIKRLWQQGNEIYCLLGFRNSDDVFWVEKFKEYGTVTTYTDDGSFGEKGLVTQRIAEDFLEKNWSNVYACGPVPMLKELKGIVANFSVEGYFSLEERMACGVGACYGCVCNNQRVCVEGPVFPMREVVL
ncbi:MAG: dihydroorotate dehydrogenase electron transfer subunit [Firmicutes bacterium]|nr:dihydroorotate dehydrogenase electron transfer subunit [Bacillota bacterium]